MSRLSQMIRASMRRFGFSKEASLVPIPGVVDGFDTTIGEDHLFDECRRLGLTPVLPVVPGYRRRSLGVQAVGPDGVSWVKISALRGMTTNPLRKAELAAAKLEGISKPKLLSAREWSEGDRHWLALRMTMAPALPVEPRLFAGTAAARLEAPWIASLKQAVDAVGRLKSDRSSITAGQIRDLIKRRFGAGVRYKVDEWRCAHGDLHWSNVTHPQIMLLDWEQWGRAPRGHDAAHLIVFSCAVPDLVRKLEAAFAADLDTASGRIAWLASLARRLNELDLGIHDAAYRPHLEAMAARVLARNR